MEAEPLYSDQRGKLNMALMFIQAGRAELAFKALTQIADDAQRWHDSQQGTADTDPEA